MAKQQRTVELAEVGSTGLRRWSGYVDEEFHRDLRGRKAVKVYREMADNHPVIGAAMLAVKLLAKQATKTVVASKHGDPQLAEQARAHVESALDDMEGKLDGVINDALSCMIYGWAALEKVYKIRRGASPFPEMRSKYDDGLVGWRKLAIRSQESLERWEFTESGEWCELVQLPPPDYKLRRIPRSKLLLFRLDAPKGNPEGRSLLRNAYVPYYMQRQLEFIEGVGVERNLSGFPIMQVPPEIMSPNATPAQKAIRAMCEDLVRKVKADQMAGLVTPAEETPDGRKTGYKFGLVTTSGKNAAETDAIIKRYRSEVAISLMCEFFLLGLDKVGSFALSSDKTALFALIVGALLDIALGTINEDAIPDLVRLNGWPAEVSPIIERGDIEAPDLQALAAYVSSLAGHGLLAPDRKLEEHLRETAGLPLPETPEEAQRMAEELATKLPADTEDTEPPEAA